MHEAPPSESIGMLSDKILAPEIHRLAHDREVAFDVVLEEGRDEPAQIRWPGDVERRLRSSKPIDEALLYPLWQCAVQGPGDLLVPDDSEKSRVAPLLGPCVQGHC